MEQAGHLLGLRAREKGIDLVTCVAEQVPGIVSGDQVRLIQILTNLVGNALKFTEKGSVSIDAELERDRGDASLVRFTVTDTGVGIPQEVQPTLFSRSSRATDRRRGSTGGRALAS